MRQICKVLPINAVFCPFNIASPDQMSSTLFGRGTHTQVGAMHRAEAVNRELAEIRALLVEVRAIPDTVRELKEMVLDMKARLDTMNIPELVPQVKQEQLDELATRIEALKVLQAPQVTAANIQALERRIDAKIAKKYSESVAQSAPLQKSALPSAES